MSVEYLKRASKSAASGEQDVREVVARMLREIKTGGEAKAVEYGRAHDGWTGDVVVSRGAIDAASEKVSPRMRDDIRYAYQRVRDFAVAQRASLTEFEIELVPGLLAGQKLIPVSTAGCYVPGGRYSHVASAIMTATTAKVAGVERVIACTPPNRDRGIHPRRERALGEGRARRRDHASVECEYSAIPGAGSSASRIVPVSDSVITSFEVPGR